ncbi:hypothetical protein NIES4071_09310 [Calothrix sp. NIES-4071]|nr:hypothetical protein NIES4071_09310 [Calothrix sp. NIES-4071]BAZ55273.1 hypothetical protein NIES4105_09270 [Calothrix sp. NIES-4105]
MMPEEHDFTISKANFFYPRYPYRGNFTPENLVFNSNLQEFAQKVGYICGLQTSGKISPEEAYTQIKKLWKQLKQAKKKLNIGQTPLE